MGFILQTNLNEIGWECTNWRLEVLPSAVIDFPYSNSLLHNN